MEWKSCKVLITGGCSFIGSHLADALVARGASVRIIDNLSSGKLENIKQHVGSQKVTLIQRDLMEPGVVSEAVDGMDLVFHLAADHGGRGYVDLHQAACATNLALDGLVFRASLKAGVKKVVFALPPVAFIQITYNQIRKKSYISRRTKRVLRTMRTTCTGGQS